MSDIPVIEDPSSTPGEDNIVIDEQTKPVENEESIANAEQSVNEGEDSEESSNSAEQIGQEQYVALYQECVRIKLQNEKCAEQIHRYNKVTKRFQKERSFLMKKLDGFGDNYRNEKLNFLDEEIRNDDHSSDESRGKINKKVKRKLKVKRLQNAPKKPSNAFLMFCQKNRSVVQKEHRRLHKNEIGRQEMTRRLAEIWKITPTENKKAYYEMYEKDKVRYALEMKKFENKIPEKTNVGEIAGPSEAVENPV